MGGSNREGGQAAATTGPITGDLDGPELPLDRGFGSPDSQILPSEMRALIKRARAAEALAEHHQALHAEWAETANRLERVREAAAEVISAVPDQEFVKVLWPAISQLRAALAGVEEKP